VVKNFSSLLLLQKNLITCWEVINSRAEHSHKPDKTSVGHGIILSLSPAKLYRYGTGLSLSLLILLTETNLVSN
jgi:hypothetical protein